MNKTTLIGTISQSTITTTRTSGVTDTIPISTSQSGYCKVIGSLHTYNTPNRHLQLYIQPDSVTPVSDTPSDNLITIEGFVCKSPIFRVTPNGRKITELLIASPNPNTQADYIPCVAWGNNAVKAAQYKISEEVNIIGRIQSRDYLKEGISHTTIEISITEIN